MNSPHEKPVYRAYPLHPDGKIAGVPAVIHAENDEIAVAKARLLVLENVGVEVWDRARLVVRIPAEPKTT